MREYEIRVLDQAGRPYIRVGFSLTGESQIRQLLLRYRMLEKRRAVEVWSGSECLIRSRGPDPVAA